MQLKLAGALLLSGLLWSFATAALGQEQPLVTPPPVKETVDARGVDLITGALTLSVTPLTIGTPGKGGMSYSRSFVGNGWRESFVGTINATGSSYMVSLGGSSESFTSSSGVFTADAQTGSTLTASGSTYTYTTRDGTVMTFNPPQAPGTGPWEANVARISQITKPAGEVITFTYEVIDPCRNGSPAAVSPAQTQENGTGQPAASSTAASSSAGPSSAAVDGSSGGPQPNQAPPCQTGNTVERLASYSNNFGYEINLIYYPNTTTLPNPPQIHIIHRVSAYNEAVSGSASLGGQVTLGTDAYNSSASTRTLTDPAGQVTEFGYDSAGRMTSYHSPQGGTLGFTVGYDGNGRVHTYATAAGTWTYAYSDGGGLRTTTVTDPNGHTHTTQATLSIGRISYDTDGNGRTTTFYYDAAGTNLTAIKKPEGGIVYYTYDGRGNLTDTRTSAKPGSGLADITTHANYDASCSALAKCNLPNWSTDATGARTDFSYYAPAGLLTAVIAPANATGIRKQTNFYYADLYAHYYINGSLQQAPSPVYVLGTTTACATAQSCDGSVSSSGFSIGYDTSGAASNLLPTVSVSYAGDFSLSAYTYYSYDAVGNATYVTTPRLNPTRNLYDADRRVLGVIGPDPDGSGPQKNRATRYTYTNGQLTLIEQGSTNSQSDADWANFQSLAQNQKYYDGAGRLYADGYSSSLSGGDYRVVNYQYDAANRLLCTAIRLNVGAFGALPGACSLSATGFYGQDRITYVQYDAADQATSVTEGYGTPTQRTASATSYGADGEVATQTDGVGNRTTYVYDGFDRLSQVQFPSTSQGAGSSNSANYQQYTYDNDGRVTADRRRDGSTVNYAYDSTGNVSSRTGAAISQVNYSYDVMGRLTTAGNSGQTMTYSYDALGRLINQSGALGAIAMQYDVDGNLTRLQWPDGSYASYVYDTAGEMAQVTDPSTSLAFYTYDDLGRRTGLYHANAANSAEAACTGYGYGSDLNLSVLNVDAANCGASENYTFAYNTAGQLRSSTSSNAAYDWTPPSQVVARPYVTNGLNQYTTSGGAALAYDGLGNVTGDTRTTYGYDGLGKLTALGNGATLGYDPADNLFQTTGASTTRFLYLGSTIIGEYDASGNVLRRYVPGAATDEVAGWYDGPGAGGYANRRYSLTDRQGSVVAVTNDSGSVLGVNTYDESGNPGPANIGRFQFNGAPWIPEAGLYHMRARDYSTTLGRFMQADPIGYGDGLNFYNYVHGDPVNGWDPSGLGCGFGDEPEPGECDYLNLASYAPSPAVDQIVVTATLPSPSAQTALTLSNSYTVASLGPTPYMLPQSAQVAEVVVTGHRYHTDNQVCAMALSASQQGELLRRFAVPGYEGERLDNGVYYAHTGALPGGFVTTQFSNGYRSVTNTTTQFHVFVGTVTRNIYVSGGMTRISTDGSGNAGSDLIGRTRDAANQAGGPSIFDFEDFNAGLYAKFAFPGC